MNNKENINKALPLSVMLESGSGFVAQGKEYTIKPLKISKIDEFVKDNLFIGENQLFNLTNDKSKEKLDKWIKSQIVNADGTSANLKQLETDEWDLDDLKRMIKEMLQISG